jgi:signal transduction histidine kinase
MPPLTASRVGRDLLLGAVLTAVAEVELVLLDPSELTGSVLGHHLLNLLILLAFGVRRVSPIASIVVACLGFAVQPVMGSAPIGTPYLALLFLLGSLGWYASIRIGAAGVALTLCLGLLADAFTSEFRWADLAVNAVIIVLAWGAAHALRRATDRRLRVELAADRTTRAAILAERERISRDLHDSLAHALTLITLQAGSARERTDEALARSTLGDIERTGREALADLHRFLDLVGPQDGEAPGLAHLPDLVDGVRRGGLDVELDLALDEQLRPSVATTIYRVVQEGLTNVVRHSDAGNARVEVVREQKHIVARVTNDGRPRAACVQGSGRGLDGLRERLRLFDGSVDSGPTDRGWHLEARIPLVRSE